ncbi:MAG: class II fumarate hydratase [Anaerococcus sp.]|uniref:class II fumarate hydratase n=1 Tax=Anaerococcus sp. TaxID=1872515 RepID=UPI0026244A69|nr:class II fumarate hydratase [Anaerococcus sp.]MCI5972922.1 class II fumarate hydratase [Anaerococcus sp.]MDD6918102.1 class II fumarate hydratase [Peptoniphilaceae bacterium]MDY2927096.1 class II fumarate hydratase [Anaerococcus sp.]
MDKRIERDSLGEIEVDNDKYWGAQTQRSFMNFPKGLDLMPKEVIRALSLIKKAAAIVNLELGKIDEERKNLIVYAADRILKGDFDDQFPLTVWQTGSGTQSNMNVNEVIAHIANEKCGENLIHPNDHVNKSQSSNDTFPTAMHMASLNLLDNELLPEIDEFIDAIESKAREFEGIIKTGRTHLQDATPISLSSEIRAYSEIVRRDKEALIDLMEDLRRLPIGGTAVGTGLNAPESYSRKMIITLERLSGLRIIEDSNKFVGISSKQAMARVHSGLKVLAEDLNKIANDLRFLSCGPRTGIGELILPTNEPGSSIMPGKVNPTQVEMMTMAAIQVMANDTAISIANASGQLELNTYMPLIIYNMVKSIKLLTKAMTSFRIHLIEGLIANKEKIEENLDKSLMLVTSLSPLIGYDKAAELAKFAHKNNLSLREANKKLGFVSDTDFVKTVDPREMI